ncbi:hypothetical protein TNCV_3694921 [Trichonephila clavipes]|nr:hypothetical protein TNCV_3694921 [Trichonephila clavipes]
MCNDLRDIAPVLQGACMLIWTESIIHAMFPQSFPMYTVVLEKQATKQLARLQELWWKQATEDLANEEAKWMYTVVLEKQATKQLARLQELWWKQATEDLANEEAKWVKLKDKKASYRIPQRN